MSWSGITGRPAWDLIYQLTSDRKTIIKANYGHYYEGMTEMSFARMTKSIPLVSAFLYNWDTDNTTSRSGPGTPPRVWPWAPTSRTASAVSCPLASAVNCSTDLAMELTFIYKYTDNFYSW